MAGMLLRGKERPTTSDSSREPSQWVMVSRLNGYEEASHPLAGLRRVDGSPCLQLHHNITLDEGVVKP